ncbi:UvrD-helicase domain-containing protein [Pseudomonas sp. NCHU5208]|uniref:UvrD-helicase domain-containing protein n=1 Tax=unclassified Pseudomonas TaxID=196821 RepID=UPI003F9D5DA6
MSSQADSTTTNDHLSPSKRVLAALLSGGLDLIGAVHPRSVKEGQKRSDLPPAPATPQLDFEVPNVRILLQYRPENVSAVPGTDVSLFSEQRLPATAEAKTRMRADCGRYLPPDQQPTAEQWKAIHSVTATTSITGAAGTGKTQSILLRVIYLHIYLKVPLDNITVLTFSREARQDTAAELQALLSAWQVDIALQVALSVVKTPRSAVIEQVRAVPNLGGCMPFEVLNDRALESLDDGRPHDTPLTPRQQKEMSACLHLLYRSDKRFADLMQRLFKASLQLQRLEVDAPTVIQRAPMAWKLSTYDDEMCDVLEAQWSAAGMWPLEGIQPRRQEFKIRGHAFSSNGYIPQLGMYVVLGFDRSENRHAKRSPAAVRELYKDVAIKRTMLQAYFAEPLLHVDSYQEAHALVGALKEIQRTPPSFSYQLEGSAQPVPLLEAFNAAASMIDALGLEVTTIPARLNFRAGSADSVFFEALGIYWQTLERQLASLAQPSFPFGRLFDMFSESQPENLRHVPSSVLMRCRHMLVDNGEDHVLPVASWIRGVLAEIQRRDSSKPYDPGHCCSLLVAGDANQWAYGSSGTAPRLLAGVEESFPAGGSCSSYQLQECFRSNQLLIDAGQSLLLKLGSGYGRNTRAVGRVRGEPAPVQIHEKNEEVLLQVCNEALARRNQVLVLIDEQQDHAWVDATIGDLIRKERTEGGRRIRVRSFHKAKALQADVVILVGDPSAGASSSYRNQLYKLAGFSTRGDAAPADTVLEGEALRLAYIAITRARQSCHWFPNRVEPVRTATSLVSLSDELFQRR